MVCVCGRTNTRRVSLVTTSRPPFRLFTNVRIVNTTTVSTNWQINFHAIENLGTSTKDAEELTGAVCGGVTRYPL